MQRVSPCRLAALSALFRVQPLRSHAPERILAHPFYQVILHKKRLVLLENIALDVMVPGFQVWSGMNISSWTIKDSHLLKYPESQDNPIPHSWVTGDFVRESVGYIRQAAVSWD